jgi:hypothetical protein
MPRYVVEIRDQKAKALRITIDIGRAADAEGTFRTAQRGYLSFNESTCFKRYSTDTARGMHLFLFGSTEPGIRLWEWADGWLVNDKGRGWLKQEWAIGMEPGFLDWVVVD